MSINEGPATPSGEQASAVVLQAESSPEASVWQAVFCPQCGYDLRGLPTERCPECGTEFDRAALSASRLPWMHRRRLGRIQAYWQTVRMVMFRREEFWREAALPVRYADAQRFRWVTLLHLCVPLFVAMWLLYPMSGYLPVRVRVSGLALDDLWLLIGWHIGIVLAAVVITGLPSYFFHPRYMSVAQQNRSVAMSYYTCAPLAWTPVIVLFGGFGYRLVGGGGDGVAVVTGYIGAAMAGLFFFWWWLLLGLSRRAVGREPTGLMLVAVAIPVLWLLLGVLTLGGIDLVFRFPFVVYYSLHA